MAQPDQDILERCRKVLALHYGARLRKLILFGSAARGEAGPESDLDLLVVLGGPADVVAEIRVLTDLLFPLQLESDHYISAQAASLEDYEAGRIQLYRNIQREGIVL
jgi:predicted nucleotidyltransferase